MSTSYCLEPPKLHFGEDGVPRSATFDDVYFDKEAGLAETEYVFIQQNNLSERFAALNDGDQFTIAETGFGTGLNFLCTWHHFVENESKGWLHFVSVEKYPLDKMSLQNALAAWPSLSRYAKLLVDNYPTLCQGWHRVNFNEHRVSLTLWLGDAGDGFSGLAASVDAWFLDGFAPSKNPQMWNEQLFQAIGKLSHLGTTCATFTAAGIVRRGLQASGFKMEKVKGFGHKREMLRGTFEQGATTLKNPWFYHQPKRLNASARILVVGSGIAGASTARALVDKGFRVQVWEADTEIASGGSGNIQGMLYPKLQATNTPINRFYLAAFLFAQATFTNLNQSVSGEIWRQCGLLQRAKNSAEAEKFEKMLGSQLYPPEVCFAKQDGEILLPLSGWVAPKLACAKLLDHERIQVHLGNELLQLEQTQQGWEATGTKSPEPQHFDRVVLCTAGAINQHSPVSEWPVKTIRGQVSRLSVEHLDTQQQTTALALDQVLCADGYVSPPLDGHLNFGATYDLTSNEILPTLASHSTNLNKLANLLNIDTENIAPENLTGRVGFRCTVADYAPIVGPVSNPQVLLESYAPLRQNAKWQPTELLNNGILEGLYVNVGHGSRGLVSAPLSAEYLASVISGAPSPLESAVAESIHPNRFAIRQLKRNSAG
ncbi:bifunctional tRNA (5-methylaminomethyl-2-thiouridine)(34)-methyltransferase MnmD/FAD-dependent 5-carboxymethylaminomethyl-2-thiouridine(34) oxidoreductase MnmC [Maribrevibacterium harenarium]|uniref:tRNA 5-methylaminomethyl-2-thiouridine biosynthesis bifunctional protein MnmC n=1 Tax=Maribrevibacterium harenarium TaxID=2589817 RepID=A0A501X2M5_9GAMM|nr:bifunctional tRNA (5-methylaminomethyl-2-thiouridine)(34)-methyltransferase MnmD/FAD-dependent 5-carboxymethylaminomethyl-2-thiouridine(34) oxidoreductase MnmC [Maribrevibacterium harenarium]TPE54740.1 bifunctional tRNA (5-methylaminomethyl-2-thiouridine)(34)-methyltransferase MnmD/FAD-dependent 5-carboxymethylaminomethyl-2-thiouridine(34) oxidoreductase MnmC [Maribrevibacterium harenarium]